MTLLFMDGFDHFTAAGSSLKYSGSNLSSASVGSTTPDTRHGAGQWIGTTNTGFHLTQTFSARASWVVGFAAYFGAMPTGVSIAGFMDGANFQATLVVNADGTLSVTRNGTAVLGGTSTATVQPATWNYIEWKITIANSIGSNSCIVRLNGTNIINVTAGEDLQATANASATGFRIKGASSTLHCFDDLYICDQSGGVNDDFLGDVKVVTLYPSGAGNSTDWTASAGSNYQCVDETQGNGDTDYVSESTAGDHDTYAFGNISDSGTVIGIQTNMYARKDDAGTREVAAVVRSGGTDYDGATVALSTSYAILWEVRETDPATTSAWDITGVNALEAGPKLVT